MYTNKQVKKLQKYADKNIASMMISNPQAMIDFLLLIEPTLKREDLERANENGTLYSQSFDPSTKQFTDEVVTDE